MAVGVVQVGGRRVEKEKEGVGGGVGSGAQEGNGGRPSRTLIPRKAEAEPEAESEAGQRMKERAGRDVRHAVICFAATCAVLIRCCAPQLSELQYQICRLNRDFGSVPRSAFP